MSKGEVFGRINLINWLHDERKRVQKLIYVSVTLILFSKVYLINLINSYNKISYSNALHSTYHLYQPNWWPFPVLTNKKSNKNIKMEARKEDGFKPTTIAWGRGNLLPVIITSSSAKIRQIHGLRSGKKRTLNKLIYYLHYF